MEKDKILDVDVDNDVKATLQICEQQTKQGNQVFQELAVCLLANDTPIVLNKWQADRLAGQLKRLAKQLEAITNKTILDYGQGI